MFSDLLSITLYYGFTFIIWIYGCPATFQVKLFVSIIKESSVFLISYGYMASISSYSFLSASSTYFFVTEPDTILSSTYFLFTRSLLFTAVLFDYIEYYEPRFKVAVSGLF